MAATKLSLFNGAMRLLRTRKLTAGEVAGNSRESARVLNDVWDAQFVRGCLESGAWRHAIRTRQLLADSGLAPDFGLRFAFPKEDDWVRTVGIYVDEMMQIPQSNHRDEVETIFADVDTLYVSYVSDDAEFGGDLSKWPVSFQKFVEARLAHEAAGPTTQAGQEMFQYAQIMLDRAQGKDVLKEPTRSIPPSSWVRARMNGGGSFGPSGYPRF